MFESKLYVLVAYPYFKKNTFEFLMGQPKENYHLIVDSGAFTAWNTGKEIKLDEYCNFLDTIEPLQPFKAVQLDVFGDPEKSWEQYQIMKERGYDVMPVFTRGESLDRLEEMYEDTDYIMFGGVVIGSGNKGYVKWWCERNKGRDAHWLGFVDMKFIKHYKPYSVDSSTWTSAGRFGHLNLTRHDGTMKSVGRPEFSKKPKEETLKLLRGLGLTDRQISILRFKDSWRGGYTLDYVPETSSEGIKGYARLINALSHVKRAFDVRKHVGTRIYLAASGENELKIIFTAHDFLKSRGII